MSIVPVGKSRLSCSLGIRLADSATLRALAECYRESADHLELDWTEDPIELKIRHDLIAHFRDQWVQLLDKADKIDIQKSVKVSP